MKLIGPLIVVRDVAVSKKFYETLFDQKVKFDLGENQQYESGLMLQGISVWPELTGIAEDAVVFQSKNAELYFETEDYFGFLEKLGEWPDINYAHESKEFPWGQHSIAIYDPDGHLVEIGESMASVVKRFLEQGMRVEEIVEKTEHPLAFVLQCKAELD